MRKDLLFCERIFFRETSGMKGPEGCSAWAHTSVAALTKGKSHSAFRAPGDGLFIRVRQKLKCLRADINSYLLFLVFISRLVKMLQMNKKKVRHQYETVCLLVSQSA